MEQKQNGISAQAKKKALVFITGPYQLLQAIWFVSEHPDYEYDVIIKTTRMNDTVKTQIVDNCRKTGMFNDVNLISGVDMESGLFRQGVLFIKMAVCFILGMRSRMTGRLIQNAIGEKEYELIVVDSENSILSGAFIDHSDMDYKVTIMQEGTTDLLKRLDRPKSGIRELVYYLLAKMGYCNPGILYKMKKTQNCVKLCSVPRLMQYFQFARIDCLILNSDNFSYRRAIQNTFNQMDWSLLKEDPVILLPSPLELFDGGIKEYNALRQWMVRKAGDRKLLIKKHPRDVYGYEWNEMKVQFINTGIPAELLLSQITNQKVVFSFVSTCIMDILDRDIDYEIIRFDSIKNEYYNSSFDELVERLEIPEARIIHLSCDEI